MRDLSTELLALISRYGNDTKRLLKENCDLGYFYSMSDIRENLLEWYEFKPSGTLLQIGADYGALTGLYSRKVANVVVLDEDERSLEVAKARYQEVQNVSYVNESLYEHYKQIQGDHRGQDVACETVERYDYITMIGSLKKPYEDGIHLAKMLLKPGGMLIVSGCNKFGVKYFAGAKKDEDSFTQRELVNLLTAKTEGSISVYYPMQDYKLPSTLYSKQYLPKKGDLTYSIIAYDYPKYLNLDVGSAWDEVCEDERFESFANSYLMFWSASPMQTLETSDDAGETIFVKYNKTRKEEFQIKTCIVEKEWQRLVEKSALREEGKPHIQSFLTKYEALKNQNPNIQMAKPCLSEDGWTATFTYLTGETYEEVLGNEIKAGKAPLTAMREAMERVCEVGDEYKTLFHITPEFTEVFGEIPPLEDEAYTVSNIDALFENILVTEKGIFCLDYEWVFEFPIPVRFVKYRILYYFYETYKTLMGYEQSTDFLLEFDITPELIAIYQMMEQRFQDYVHGENQQIYLSNYMQDNHSVDEITEIESQLEERRERVRQLEAEVEEKNVTLNKLQEVARLTNNHVANLDIIIGDLRHENGEIGKTLSYLNDHLSLTFRARMKLSKAFNHFFPRGTRKRKIILYGKSTLRHPVKYMKLYTTEQGRNLIRGDFDIGDNYRNHGKLIFPKTANPKVSIIIPVYNQIHYTYDCLASILEYTADVNYEVIIADDVSTDATKDLTEFAENIIICRNEKNEGFLRNCNQAAKAAKGQYIMFLNNDTQVTQEWLSSLLTLIESDDSIGMVGSKLVYPDGRLQEAGGILWSDGSGWNYGRLDDPDKPEYNYVKDVDYISGAAILLSNRLWKQIGGFDERYTPAYCEDSDLAFEVRKAGYRVVYQPLSKVIHFEGISNGTDVEGEGLKRYQVDNSRKLREKWADEFKKQCVNTGNPNPFRARERSMGKEVILVVDHYVPTFDRDAGSKTTYQYLKMFLQKGYVIKFLGDNFLHEEPYSTTLQQMGIEILYGMEFQAKIWDWIKENSSEISYAYLNRPHIAANYINFIKGNTDIKVIYYGHDLHFLREAREFELSKDPEKKRLSDYWKSIELSLMHKADISYYPSYIERNAIKAIDSKIAVKDITAYVFDEFLTDIPEDFAKREGLLFVGGFAHPPNADAVLWFAKDIFPMIRKCLQIPFYIVGSKVTEEIKALEQPNNGIIVKGFVSEEELARLYLECKIVVVPLRYGAGVKGKVVEAIYYGAPIVTTSIGAEGIPEAERTMMIEDAPEDFANAVVSVYQDDSWCRKLSLNTQDYIRQYYSVEAAWERISEDFTIIKEQGSCKTNKM